MAALTNRSKVRLLVGDTDPGDPILSDNEIDHFITGRTTAYTGSASVVNVIAAAADCAGAIAAEYARQFDFAEDGQSFARSQRVAHYWQLEQDLRKRQGGYSHPVAGGTANVF